MPKLDKILMVVVILIVGFLIGYLLRIKHEASIRNLFNSKAQYELRKIENEFEQAIEKPRQFLLFNGRFKVWPVKSDDTVKPFSYSGAGDNTKQ